MNKLIDNIADVVYSLIIERETKTFDTPKKEVQSNKDLRFHRSIIR